MLRLRPSALAAVAGSVAVGGVLGMLTRSDPTTWIAAGLFGSAALVAMLQQALP